MSIMLVLAFAACPTDGGGGSKNSEAVLMDVQALEDSFLGDGVLGDAIRKVHWDEYTDNTALTEDEMGVLDFKGAAESANVVFTVIASSKATVTYAVVQGSALPADGDFKNITVRAVLSTNDAVYFKVVSEDNKNTNYYCVIVTGLGDAPSPSAGISGVTIGDGNPVSPSQNQGNSTIGTALPINYILPSSNMAGAVTLELTRNNAGQSISWAVGNNSFTDFAEPGEGSRVLSAVIGANGLQDETVVYIRVIAADKVTTLYYAFKISVGNVAEIETLTLAGEAVTFLGEPGPAWNDVRRQGTFDYQEDTPEGGFAIVAAAKDGGTITWAVTSNSSVEPDFTNPAANLPLGNGSFLYIKVTSINGKVTNYYRITIFTKAAMIVYYGQPDITLGVNGGAPALDPMWSTTEWMFNVSRVNLNEMTPAFRFYNTVEGHYDTTGVGHTEGMAKAFWDDGGMYVYAEMTYHDYYDTADDMEAEKLTERATVVTPPLATVADNNAHLYDSLEIFTNERVQQYTEGGYGIQYRVAPSPDGQTVIGTNSRVSGNPPATDAGAGASAINVLRDSGKYYTWIRTENGKEVGYSIITYIPWIYKYDANANLVYADGKVKTDGNDAGPTVGLEFQLDAVTVGGTRDAILTWNGVTGQSYNQVRNYGKATLITGNLAERGITRGEKDALPVTVSFDTNGGIPASIGSIDVANGFSAGSLFPANPTKVTFVFDGWYDESANPPVRYTANTIIAKNLHLTARWTEDKGMGTEIWSLADYLTENSYGEGATIGSGTPRPFRATSGSRIAATVSNGGVTFVQHPTGTEADYDGFNIFVHGLYGGSSGSLSLNFEEKDYQLVITGSVVGTAPDGSTVRVTSERGTHPWFTDPDNGFISANLGGENKSFAIGGMLPKSWDPAAYDSSAGNECIRIRRDAVGWYFRIDTIVIYEKDGSSAGPGAAAATAVLYDMQDDPALASFSSGTAGGTHTNNMFTWSLSSGGSTIVDTDAKTVTTAGRGGTGQGIRFNTPWFVSNVAKPGYSYTLYFSGEFMDNGGGFPRFRNETGSVLILAGTADNLDPEDTNKFSLSATFTTEQLAGYGLISFGNTGGGSTNIKYTGIKITEFPPNLLEDYSAGGTFTVTASVNARTTAKTTADGSGNPTGPRTPVGFFGLTASGSLGSTGSALAFDTTEKLAGTQSLRYTYAFPAGNRYVKFGYDSYNYSLEGKTEVVIYIKGTAEHKFRIMLQSSGTEDAECEKIFTVPSADTWLEMVIPLSDFTAEASGILEAVYFSACNHTFEGGIGNVSSGSSTQAYSGTLWIDSIVVR